MARLVAWVRLAHNEIQDEYADWDFLWRSNSFPTVAAQNTYDLPSTASMGAGNEITDFGSFDFYDGFSRVGAKVYIGTTQLNLIPWDDYDPNDYSGTAEPYDLTIRPDGAFVLAPTPDTAYTLNFEYFRTPLDFAANTDTPLFPVRFHDAIVWRAVLFYANNESAGELVQQGSQGYAKALANLKADQLKHARNFNKASGSAVVVTPQ